MNKKYITEDIKSINATFFHAPLDCLITELTEFQTNHTDHEGLCIRLEPDVGYRLVGQRLETDVEYHQRLESVKQWQDEQDRMKAEKKRQDLAMLKRLLENYNDEAKELLEENE